MAPNANATPELSALTSSLQTLKALTETYILPTLPGPISTVLQATLNSTTTSNLTPYLASTYDTILKLTTNMLSGTGTNANTNTNSNTNSNVYTDWLFNTNTAGSPSSSTTANPSTTSLLTTTTIILVSTYLSFKVLNYIRRTIISWVLFGIKLFVLLLTLQVAWYVNVYGWDKFVNDATWWAGMLWGVLERVIDSDSTSGGSGTSSGDTNPGKPRGLRSRADVRRDRGRKAGYAAAAANGRDQVPVGGGWTRW